MLMLCTDFNDDDISTVRRTGATDEFMLIPAQVTKWRVEDRSVSEFFTYDVSSIPCWLLGWCSLVLCGKGNHQLAYKLHTGP